MSIERRRDAAAHWTERDYHSIFDQLVPHRIALVIECTHVVPDFDLRQQLQKLRGICGFIVTRYFDGEWEIENIAVERAARRRGIATGLMRHFMEMARNRERSTISLEVRESNIAARKLYEKWGFVEAGRRKFYYSNPIEDAVLLHCEIGGFTHENS